MSVAAARSRAVPAVSWERVLAALPLVTIFVWACLIYAWQAWAHETAWFFYDELKYTELARSLAAGDHPELRGEPASFSSLYTFLIAPAWWIGDPHAAYDAAKYVGVLAMSLTVFPAYGLARLLVPRLPALFAAAGSVAIPSLAYSSLLITEVLAYPFATLCFFLSVKALATRRLWWLAAAALACGLAPLVRSQLVIIPGAFALAALLVVVTGPGARRVLRELPRPLWALVPVVVVAAGVAADWAIGRYSEIWVIVTRNHFGQMVEYGLWALGALAIGLGVLPVIVGVAAVAPVRGEPFTDVRRAFATVVVANVFVFALYTGVKAAFNTIIWATIVQERNLMYVSPLIFAGTALWLHRRRLHPLALVAVFAAVVYLLVDTPYEFFYPYIEALGFSLPTWAWLNHGIDAGDWEHIFVAAALASVLLAIAVHLAARSRLTTAALSGIAALVLAWNLGGELAAGDAMRGFSHRLYEGLPQPLDWVDRTTGSSPSLYLGQQITNPNALHLLEFWNPSLTYVGNLDGVEYPGPGRVLTPKPVAPDGRLEPDPGARYVVAPSGIDVFGRIVGAREGLRVFQLSGGLRLAAVTSGVFSDGWAGRSSAYTRYRGEGAGPGFIYVEVGRPGWCGRNLPGPLRIDVGPLALGPDGAPRIRTATTTKHWQIKSCSIKGFRLPTPPAPFRVEVAIPRTFVPAEVDSRESDRRELGAQVSFEYDG